MCSQTSSYVSSMNLSFLCHPYSLQAHGLKQAQRLTENDSFDGTPQNSILHLISKIKVSVFTAYNIAPSTDTKFVGYFLK